MNPANRLTATHESSNHIPQAKFNIKLLTVASSQRPLTAWGGEVGTGFAIYQDSASFRYLAASLDLRDSLTFSMTEVTAMYTATAIRITASTIQPHSVRIMLRDSTRPADR